MPKKYVIIGTSAVALGASTKLRQLDAQAEIICISDEKEDPYNKCFLADYAAGIKPLAEVFTLKPAIAIAKNIKLMLGCHVVSINPESQEVVIHDGTSISYDALLLGMGSSPYMPPIDNLNNLHGVFTFHTLADIETIAHYRQNHKAKKVVVIGAGLSGLECADALYMQGMQVTIVERASQVLPHSITMQAATFITEKIKAAGIQLVVNQQVQKLIGDAGQASGVQLASGDQLPADMVIIATGLTPNSGLARAANIAVHDRNGVLVNEYLQTSQKAIWAAGDLVMIKNQITGNLVRSTTWPDAMQQGMIAASNMAGIPQIYTGTTPILSSAFFGVKFAACGDFTTLDLELLQKTTPDAYEAILTLGDRLKGFILIGDQTKRPLLRRLLLTQESISTHL